MSELFKTSLSFENFRMGHLFFPIIRRTSFFYLTYREIPIDSFGGFLLFVDLKYLIFFLVVGKFLNVPKISFFMKCLFFSSFCVELPSPLLCRGYGNFFALVAEDLSAIFRSSFAYGWKLEKKSNLPIYDR